MGKDALEFIIKIIENKYFISIASFILGIVVTALLSQFVTDKYKELKERRNHKNKEFVFEWFPSDSIKNPNINGVKNIDTYPKDFAVDFEKKDMSLSEYVSGIECFKMKLTKMIHTEKDKYEIYKNTNYGISYLFHNVDNQDEFNVYAKTNAEDIMSTFNEWIKEIYYIKKYNDKSRIQIGMSLKGRNELVKIDVPLITFGE